MKIDSRKILIRNARCEDAEVLLIAQKSITLEPGQLITLPHELKVNHFETKIESLSETPKGVYLVAEVEGAIVAHGVLDPLDMESAQHVAQMTLVVHAGHQGKGIGEKLLLDLKQWARVESNLEKIEIQVPSTNVRALSLYKKHNFKEEGRFVRRMKLNDGHYVDNILMGRWLY